MIVILASWLFAFGYFLTVGRSCLKMLDCYLKNTENEKSQFLAVWVGIIFTIFWLQIYQIFFAVNNISWIVGLVLFLLSLVYLRWLPFASSVDFTKFKINQSEVKVFVTALLFIFTFSYYAAHVPVWSDTYLYHFNAVSWINHYQIIPGLANLHIRLGLQSNFFILAAFLNTGLFLGNGVHIALSFLLIMLFLQITSLVTKEQVSAEQKIFGGLLLPFIIAKGWSGEINSYSTDLATAIFYILYLLILLGNYRLKRLLLLFIGLALFSFKLSGAIPIIIWFLYVISDKVFLNNTRHRAKEMVLYFWIIVLFLGSYFTRNVILSGWILFPVTIFPLPLDWSVPSSEVNRIREDIMAWARMPGAEYRSSLGQGFLYWFIPWYQKFKNVIEFKLLVFSFIGFFLFALFDFSRKLKHMKNIYFALVLSIFSILFWFTTAPDLRIGAVFFWSLLGVSAISFFVYINTANEKLSGVFYWLIVFVITFYSTGGPSIDMNLLLWELPQSHVPPVNKVQYEQDGVLLVLWVTGPPSDLCGDSALPCTPYPNKLMKFRNPSDISQGFKIDKK